MSDTGLNKITYKKGEEPRYVAGQGELNKAGSKIINNPNGYCKESVMVATAHMNMQIQIKELLKDNTEKHRLLNCFQEAVNRLRAENAQILKFYNYNSLELAKALDKNNELKALNNEMASMMQKAVEDHENGKPFNFSTRHMFINLVKKVLEK